MQPDDELLWAHLRQLAGEARDACDLSLSQSGSSAVLLDVEPLLDGRTLYFHFMFPVEQEVQLQLSQLVEIYEQKVQSSRFAAMVEQGCGPGCGTDEAAGCGGGCSTCRLAVACKTPQTQ